MHATSSANPPSKKTLWTGYVLSALPALLVLFAAVTKILRVPGVDAGFAKVGWPVTKVVGIGVIELVCVVVYLVPRSAMLGAILLTGLLGGTIATTVRVDEAYVMQLVLGVMVWGGLYLRYPGLRLWFPWRR